MNRLMAIPATVTAAGLIVLLALTIQDASANLETTKIQLDSTKMLLDKRQAQRTDLTKKISAAEQKLASTETGRKNFTAALADIGTYGNQMNQDLNTSVDNLVGNLGLATLGHAGTQLSLSGEAVTEQEVLSYVRKLTTTGRFSEITITSINRLTAASDNGSDVMNFTLALKLNSKIK
ncbi:MAG: hypothetical protein A2137_00485 [Chloroflexi bacterium RBG_16_58_8]|nr:MAG: hypothetical protein A2137_00485 [Chloroflexi bacterium RBG_16_58_8]